VERREEEKRWSISNSAAAAADLGSQTQKMDEWLLNANVSPKDT
jgi:hypothetical protein